MIDSCSAATCKLAIISIKYKMYITKLHHVFALTVKNGIYMNYGPHREQACLRGF